MNGYLITLLLVVVVLHAPMAGIIGLPLFWWWVFHKANRKET